MLPHLLSLLLLAPPQSPDAPTGAEHNSDARAQSEPAPSDAPPGEGEGEGESEGPAGGEGEFGELEVDPNADVGDPTDAASAYGSVAPLPTHSEAIEPADLGPLIIDDQPAAKTKKTTGFQEPEDFGPFFEPEPVSELRYPGDAHRPDRKQPFASVAGGTFCFVEDSVCGAALLVDADVAVGVNVITSDRGFNVPYTQLRVRGGFTIRPIILTKHRWHRWGVGLVGSWSIGSGSITATNRDPDDPNVGVTETDPIQTYRLGLINQLWLSQKRNALHLDFTLGAGNSSVLDFDGRYWGTVAEVALGWGGWGGLYFGGDFFDSDTRVVLGLRGHGIATGPMIALILLGLVAGGAAL